MSNIVLFGPPASGKGTQGALIAKKFSYNHISAGDLVREEIKLQTTTGKQISDIIARGDLVDAKTMVALLKIKYKNAQNNKMLLDGFPRTLEQAKGFNEFLANKSLTINLVIVFQVARDIIIDRILGRRICKDCGSAYHIKYKPSKINDICDICQGSNFVKRNDDNIEVINNRINNYLEFTKPTLAYFIANDIKIITMDGSGSLEVIFANIALNINELQLN